MTRTVSLLLLSGFLLMGQQDRYAPPDGQEIVRAWQSGKLGPGKPYVSKSGWTVVFSVVFSSSGDWADMVAQLDVINTAKRPGYGMIHQESLAVHCCDEYRVTVRSIVPHIEPEQMPPIVEKPFKLGECVGPDPSEPMESGRTYRLSDGACTWSPVRHYTWMRSRSSKVGMLITGADGEYMTDIRDTDVSQDGKTWFHAFGGPCAKHLPPADPSKLNDEAGTK